MSDFYFRMLESTREIFQTSQRWFYSIKKNCQCINGFFAQAPSSLLDALEQHLAALEGKKGSAANTPTQSARYFEMSATLPQNQALWTTSIDINQLRLKLLFKHPNHFKFTSFILVLLNWNHLDDLPISFEILISNEISFHSSDKIFVPR